MKYYISRPGRGETIWSWTGWNPRSSHSFSAREKKHNQSTQMPVPCKNIERVTSVKVFGIIANDRLSATDHVSNLFSLGSSSPLYALRVLRTCIAEAFLQRNACEDYILSASMAWCILSSRSCETWRFLPRSMECRCGLTMRIVCLSNACIVTKRKKDMFRFLYHTKDNLSSFLRRRMFGGGDPFYPKFWVNRPPLERNRRFW